MPKLIAGDDAPSVVLPSTDGTTFDLSALKGKRVLLTFFRFDSCPFCNLRIHRLVKRWNEFPEDTVMVGVFDASIDKLNKRMKKHEVPFTLCLLYTSDAADERHWNIASEEGLKEGQRSFQRGQHHFQK